MKKIILLLIIVVSLSGCYMPYIRTPYYQRYPRYEHRVKPGKIYKPYFRHGRY